MWGPGTPSWIIRFICHIPTGMMGINCLGTYRQSTGLGDIYDVIPHGRAFLQGMQFLGYAGTTAFGWNFFQFGASPLCSGRVLALVGVVDLVLASILIAGVIMTGMFLPDTYGPCDRASSWNNGTDGRNFFLVAYTTGSFGTSGPNGVCHGIMQNWVMAIVVIVFYVLCGLVNVILGCFGESGTITCFGSRRQYDLDDLFSCLGTPLRLLFRPIYLLYRSTRGSIYISYRYISKYMCRKKDTDRLQKPKEATIDMESTLEPNSPRLPMELVTMMTKDLHHADLVNIGHSSKYLEAAFFGEHSPDQVARELRRFACKGGGPLTNCPVCSIQTCSGCRRKAPASRHNVAFKHLTSCQAACTRCFFTNHCFRRPRPTKPGKIWTGTSWVNKTFHETTRRNAEGLSLTLGAGFSPRGGNNRVGHGVGPMLEEVCHNCASLPETAREELRDEGNVREMRRQATLPMACFECRRDLPRDGVRWWVNPETGGECRWHGHPGWVDARSRKLAAEFGG
ncbi:uncharacterized protein B0H64DRAFT_327902 [Chaetomium fimeti]|uniref:Uncharacterized protein n=1 Tax=Chaetomium fimeti TaxID=1854472 RepID=A0AAE0LQ00_9PEZI|nr:hypothetical protein B0H64DRAFT_327902 [Chaetomium fimeti]